MQINLKQFSRLLAAHRWSNPQENTRPWVSLAGTKSRKTLRPSLVRITQRAEPLRSIANYWVNMSFTNRKTPSLRWKSLTLKIFTKKKHRPINLTITMVLFLDPSRKKSMIVLWRQYLTTNQQRVLIGSSLYLYYYYASFSYFYLLWLLLLGL